jgi:signal transduction histidine kinase
MIVHDLKVPLNSLISPPPMFQGEKYESYIKNAGLQMLTLVSNILDVNKYEEQKIPIKPEQIEFRKTLEQVLQQLSVFYQQKNLIIEVQSPDNLYLKADRDLFERILINLLSNAIKFSPGNGKINIEANTENNLVHIAISDAGQGIDPLYHQLIFDKYGQLIAKSIGITRSTGLGLTFCKMAVESHGCNIGIESIVGLGSTFWFTLPACDETPANVKPTTIKFGTQSTIMLSQNDMEKVQPVAQMLMGTEIFELSRIKKELDSLTGKNPAVNEWKDLVYNAALNGNEANYTELLKAVIEPKTLS